MNAVNIEVGACIHPQQVYTCNDVNNWITTNNQGDMSNCKMNFCGSDFCSPIVAGEPEDCHTSENGNFFSAVDKYLWIE